MRKALTLALVVTFGCLQLACSEPPCERTQACCDAIGSSFGGGELRNCTTAATSGDDGQCTAYITQLNDSAANIPGLSVPEACQAE